MLLGFLEYCENNFSIPVLSLLRFSFLFNIQAEENVRGYLSQPQPRLTPSHQRRTIAERRIREERQGRAGGGGGVGSRVLVTHPDDRQRHPLQARLGRRGVSPARQASKRSDTRWIIRATRNTKPRFKKETLFSARLAAFEGRHCLLKYPTQLFRIKSENCCSVLLRTT